MLGRQYTKVMAHSTNYGAATVTAFMASLADDYQLVATRTDGAKGWVAKAYDTIPAMVWVHASGMVTWGDDAR